LSTRLSVIWRVSPAGLGSNPLRFPGKFQSREDYATRRPRGPRLGGHKHSHVVLDPFHPTTSCESSGVGRPPPTPTHLRCGLEKECARRANGRAVLPLSRSHAALATFCHADCRPGQ
jgi:hypothetical protein